VVVTESTGDTVADPSAAGSSPHGSTRPDHGGAVKDSGAKDSGGTAEGLAPAPPGSTPRRSAASPASAPIPRRPVPQRATLPPPASK
jgi:hypothetical protein